MSSHVMLYHSMQTADASIKSYLLGVEKYKITARLVNGPFLVLKTRTVFI